MFSKSNSNKFIERDCKARFSLRKLSVGVASVLLGMTFIGMSQTVQADDVTTTVAGSTTSASTQSGDSGAQTADQKTEGTKVATTTTTPTVETAQNQNGGVQDAKQTGQNGSVEQSDNDKTKNTQTETLETKSENNNLHLSDSKLAVSNDLQAQDVHTQLGFINDSHEKLGDVKETGNNFDSDTWTRLSFKGNFSVSLKDLVAGNTIKIGSFLATSNTKNDHNSNKFMALVSDGGVHYVNYSYVDEKGENKTKQVGRLIYNYTDGGHGEVVFQVDDSIFDSNNPADVKAKDRFVTFNFDVTDFLLLNYQTDKHVFKYATKENPFTETLNFVDKSYTFNVVPKIYDEIKHWDTGYVVPFGQTNTGALQDYADDYLIHSPNREQIIKDLQNSRGKSGDVYIPKDVYRFYYKISVKDSNTNNGFHWPRVSYFCRVNPANSDGKLTQESIISGPDRNLDTREAQTGLNFDALDKQLGNTDSAAAYSKQQDGSYLFVVHISPQDIIEHMNQNFLNNLGNTNTAVFDGKGEESADSATRSFYNDGVLHGLPLNITPQIRIDYNNQFNPNATFTMDVYGKSDATTNGSSDSSLGNDYHWKRKSTMSPIQDNSGSKEQAGIFVHYINYHTGEVMEGDYSNTQTIWGKAGDKVNIKVPSIDGYHIKSDLSGKVITFDNGSTQTLSDGDMILTKDSEVTMPEVNHVKDVYIFYDGDYPKNVTIKYVDDDKKDKKERVLYTDHAYNGKFGEIRSYTYWTIPAGYQIVNDELENFDKQNGVTGIKFGKEENKTYTIHLKHKTVTVTPNNPKTDKDILPDNSEKHYPDGVGKDDLNKTITRTIIIYNPDGTVASTKKQEVAFTRTATVDEVTGQLTDPVTGYSAWELASQNNKFTGLKDTDLKKIHYNYKITKNGDSVTDIPDETVDVNSKDETFKVTYQEIDETHTVKWIDDDQKDESKKVLFTKERRGIEDSILDFSKDYTLSAGYKLADNQPDISKLSADGGTTEVHLIHKTLTVHPGDHKKNGAPLPDNPDKKYQGVEDSDLTRTLTRTINVIKPGQTKDDNPVVQTVKFTQTATIDEVTGDVKYNGWTPDSQTFETQKIDSISGYTPYEESNGSDLEKTSNGYQVKTATVSSKDQNLTVTIRYKANTQKAIITYIDDDETDSSKKTIAVDTITGYSDSQSDYKQRDYSKQGYEVIKETTTLPETIVFDHDDKTDQTFEVHLKHLTTEVTPDTDTTKHLPHNSKQHYPDTVAKKYLTRTLTRIINVTDTKGKKTQTPQTVEFTRNAIVDEVTGKLVKYEDWTPKNASWDAFTVNPVDHYTTQITDENGKDVDSSELGERTFDLNKDEALYPNGYTVIYNISFNPILKSENINWVDNDVNTSDNGFSTVKTLSLEKALEGTKINTTDIKGFDDINQELKRLGYVVDTQISQVVMDGKDVYIQLHHKTETVNPDKPKTKNDKTPTGHSYKGVSESDLNKTITRTIHLIVPSQPDQKEVIGTVKFTRSAIVDAVTGNVIKYNEWEAKSTTLPPYTPAILDNMVYTIHQNTQGGAIVKSIDQNDKVTPDTPSDVYYVVYQKGQLPDVSPVAVPTKVIVRYTGSDSNPSDVVKSGFTFKGQYNTDTEKTTWDAQSHDYGNIDTPVVNGYVADIATVSGLVTPDKPVVEVTVTYRAIGHIIPVDPSGKPIPGATPIQYRNDPHDPTKIIPTNVPDVPGYVPAYHTVNPISPTGDTKVVYNPIVGPKNNPKPAPVTPKRHPKKNAKHDDKRAPKKMKYSKKKLQRITYKKHATTNRNALRQANKVMDRQARHELPATGQGESILASLVGMMMIALAALGFKKRDE